MGLPYPDKEQNSPGEEGRTLEVGEEPGRLQSLIIQEQAVGQAKGRAKGRHPKSGSAIMRLEPKAQRGTGCGTERGKQEIKLAEEAGSIWPGKKW